MFTTKENKRQNKDLAPPSEKVTPQGTKQHRNLPGFTYFLQRYIGNSYMQSMAEAGQNTLLGGVLTNQYATGQAKINTTTSRNRKAEIGEPSVEEIPDETETEESPAEETSPESEREETESIATPAGRAIIEPVRIVRSGTELWWFDGENASNYDEEAKLTAWGGRPGATRGTFRWDVVRGAGIVDFQNNSNSMTRVDANRIGIKSTDASTTRGDVRVRCRWSLGGRSKTLYHAFTVFAPNAGVGVARADNAVGAGFRTLYTIEVRDQFGTRLPRAIEVNETFGAWVSDFAGENWPPPAQVSAMSTASAQVNDRYEFDCAACTPTTVNPGTAGAGTRVDHAIQEYRAGSLTAGDGRLIKRHTLQFFRGRARQI
jgi:hypothetical protein